MDRERMLQAAMQLIQILFNDLTLESLETKNDQIYQMEVSDMTKIDDNSSGEWVTPAQAAKMVGTVTARTISAWARQKLMPARQINRRWYIHKQKLLEILDFYGKSDSQK